jgi:hypothetical protein
MTREQFLHGIGVLTGYIANFVIKHGCVSNQKNTLKAEALTLHLGQAALAYFWLSHLFLFFASLEPSNGLRRLKPNMRQAVRCAHAERAKARLLTYRKVFLVFSHLCFGVLSYE